MTSSLTVTGIPFWDPGVTQNPGSVQSLLPETPEAPWPDTLSPWNTIKMAGMRAPGLVVLKGARAKRYSTEQTPGVSGQIFNFYGYDYGQFSIKLHLWTPGQWVWLQKFLPLISPAPTSAISPKAVKADHPALRLNKIYDIYVVKVGFPDIDSHGLMTIDIECLEYLSPLNASGTGPITSTVTDTPQGNGSYKTQTIPTPPVPSTKP